MKLESQTLKALEVRVSEFKQSQLINAKEIDEAYDKIHAELSRTKAELEEARKLLGDALKAVESLDENSLGSVPDTESQQGWFIRDELAHKIGSFLSNQPDRQSK